MKPFNFLKHSFLHTFFPHVCTGCGSDLLHEDHLLCLQCFSELPHTRFEMHAANPVERIFWGRLPVTSAMAAFYFSKGSVMQGLIHELKYKNNKDIGLYLGKLIGEAICSSNNFMDVDALVPLPLFAAKERKRGYNQATLLCNGMAEILKIPVITGNIIRKHSTETQTRKGRTERWENVAGSFFINDSADLQGRHLLLVDDVITTGATLEACGTKVMESANCRLSIAALAIATN